MIPKSSGRFHPILSTGPFRKLYTPAMMKNNLHPLSVFKRLLSKSYYIDCHKISKFCRYVCMCLIIRDFASLYPDIIGGCYIEVYAKIFYLIGQLNFKFV